MNKITKGWCGPCHHRCGVEVSLEKEKVINITGDKNHPLSRGFMCARGKTLLEHLYHKDRVNFPLKRAGGRGENRWERISWKQALDEIAEKLSYLKEKYGSETLAFAHGTYRTYGWPVKRFFNLFGSPNIMGAQNICRCPGWILEWTTMGGPLFPDMRNTKLIILCGSHFKESSPHPGYSGLVSAKKNGAKLIVIDPMKNDEAELADIWLPIQPGTDVFLFLGFIKYLIENILYDKAFVEKHCYGFDKLSDHIKDINYDDIANITKISKEKIFEVAKIYGNTKPAVIPWTYGLDKQGVNANQAQRARLILEAITGNIDTEGGELLGRNGLKVITDYEMEANEYLSEFQKLKQIGSQKHRLMAYPGWEKIKNAALKSDPFYALPPVAEFGASAYAPDVYEAMITDKPYKVKAFISQASNPIVTLTNPKRIYKALLSTELNVVMDYYITPTAMLADYILPAACTLERSDIQDMHGFSNTVVANPKAIEPLYERKDDYYFFRELGIRLGQKEHWPWETIEDALDYRLQRVNITFKELCERYHYTALPKYKKYEQFGFATPTKKIELYSTILEELHYAPLPVYKEMKSSVLNDKNALTLITGVRFMPMYHSELRQIESARKAHPEPLSLLNEKTAKKYGLSDGVYIEVENNFGKCVFKLKISEKMQDDMIHLEHGWWFPEEDGKIPHFFGVFRSNCNNLCPDEEGYVAEEIGSWPYSALKCKINGIVDSIKN